MFMSEFMIGLFSTIGDFIVACAIGLFFAFPVMLLWNADLVPAVTFAHPIGWVQAWGIGILVSLLSNRRNINVDKD